MAVAPELLLDPQAALGDLALGWAGLGEGPPPIVIVRKVLHQVIFAGETLDDALTSQIQLSFRESQGVATAITRQKPATGAEDDPIEIWCGTIDRRGQGTFAKRFEGTVVRFDTTSSERSCGLICKDKLWPLEKYVQKSVKGLTLTDITGHPTATATQIFLGVLAIVGIDTSVYPATNFADTVRVLGTIAPEQYRWKHPTTARAYVDRVLNDATPGFRGFQSGNAELFLAQISGRPRGPADFALIEGYNVVGQTSGQRGTETRLQGVHVTGYDNGKGAGAIVYDVAPPGPNDPVVEHSSPLIETLAHATEMGTYLLAEADRELVKTLSLTTAADDILGPAQVHILLLPRNEITEPGFCQSLTITTSQTDFRQTPGHLAGGLP